LLPSSFFVLYFIFLVIVAIIIKSSSRNDLVLSLGFDTGSDPSSRGSSLQETTR
jgi:hypothetical protein